LKTFEELGISPSIIKALTENHIVNPSEIQERAIPFLLDKGTDFIGQAQTGTGKTAAFGLPLLHLVDTKSDKVQALVLSPTRELCQQIAKQLFTFTKYKEEKLFVEAVFGGAPIGIQIGRLQRPTHIVVATPGRLIDLLEKKAVDLSRVKTVVLDEADEMLTMGFQEDIDKILQTVPKKKATWLFSATMSTEIKTMIHKYMAPDAFKLEVNKKQLVNRDIEHEYVVCDKSKKLETLIRFLKTQGANRGVIFCRTKLNAQTLSDQLKEKHFAADVIHGDLKQLERDKVMRAFKNTKVQILIATDIAARGIDIQNLTYVIHYELPDQDEYYTHRSGRTARAGKKGLALAIVTPSDLQHLRTLEKKLQLTLTEVNFGK
jgi:ATP-dependent RNA helicase DeaD